MEYRPDPKSPPKPRIPISLRAFVYSTVKASQLESLGSKYYAWAAEIIAKSFLRFQDVMAVYLIGGGLDRCVPAVSDLDFVVVIDPIYEREFLSQFQKNLKRLTFRFPILGEVHVVRKQDWSKFQSTDSAVFSWFSKRHRYFDNRWNSEVVSQEKKVSCESSMILALLHYWKAHRFLCQSMQGHSQYFLSHFQREISKSLGSLTGEPLRIRRQENWKTLIQNTFEALEKKANLLLSTSVVSPLEVNWSQKAGIRFAIEVKQNQWMDVLRSAGVSKRGIHKTTIPGVFEAESSSYLCSNYFSVVSRKKDAPLLLPKNAVQLLKMGLGWGGPLEHLDWLTPEEGENTSFLNQVGYFTARAMQSRFELNRTLFRGKIVSSSPEKIQWLFEELYFASWALKEKRLTNDLNFLREKLKLSFPYLPSGHKHDYLEALKGIDPNPH